MLASVTSSCPPGRTTRPMLSRALPRPALPQRWRKAAEGRRAPRRQQGRRGHDRRCGQNKSRGQRRSPSGTKGEHEKPDRRRRERDAQRIDAARAIGREDAVREPRPVHPGDEKAQTQVAQPRLTKKRIQRLHPCEHGSPPLEFLSIHCTCRARYNNSREKGDGP